LKINFYGKFLKNEKIALNDALDIFEDFFPLNNNIFVELHSINKTESKALNMKYFNKNHSTDVITLPIFKDYKNLLKSNLKENVVLGDIFISKEDLKINAKKYEKSLIEELQLVLVHGLLHLLGFSHNQETKLKTYEEKILSKLWNER
jgi:probable rRNA maturation factor